MNAGKGKVKVKLSLCCN